MDRVTDQSLWIEEGSIRRDLGQKENDIAIVDYEQQLLKLETERQYILGKLSMLTIKDSEYNKLDQLFMELTSEINTLRQNHSNK
ncbi:hypothetical protein D3C81_1020820 [compost metagenome]